MSLENASGDNKFGSYFTSHYPSGGPINFLKQGPTGKSPGFPAGQSTTGSHYVSTTIRSRTVNLRHVFVCLYLLVIQDGDFLPATPSCSVPLPLWGTVELQLGLLAPVAGHASNAGLAHDTGSVSVYVAILGLGGWRQGCLRFGG